MVSASKIKFFKGRLEEIKREKLLDLAKEYPEIKVDYQSLILQGKGLMRSEEEIREMVGNLRSSCPLTIDVSRLFSFTNEREEAIKQNAEVDKKHQAARKAFLQLCKDAMDLVYFGTDEQLKKALDGLQAFEV